jgi:type II secretory pathway pseudopilin PulG
VEVLVGVALIGVLAVSLYAGMTQGFAVVQLARENLRATQILQEKMEAIRLLSWEQVGSLRTNTPLHAFSEPFYAVGTQSTSGLTYQGRVTITNAPLNESYADDLQLVIVNLSWWSGDILRQRQMQSLVSKYGLQNYIYDPQ